MKAIKLSPITGFVFLLTVCFSYSCKQAGNKPGTDNPLPEYPVEVVKPQSAILNKDYPATLKGQQTVEIRSKITGYIDQIYVDEGAFVKKGQVLFRLNNNDLMAFVRSAEAQVKVAESDLKAAQINLNKTKPLVEKNIISKFELESAESNLLSREAQLAQTKANLENAKANLQFTTITSPADGTIGTFPYRVGSLVSSANAEPLTIVSNTTKMQAYFSISEKDFLFLTKGLAGKNLQDKFRKITNISLILPDNTPYELPGFLEIASGLVDQQTGAVTMRATFDNPEGLLRSGSSGIIRIPQKIDSAIIIPQKATYELQGKHFIYTVDTGNIVHEAEIEVLAGDMKDSYVVISGLNVGDRIVLEGIVSLHDETRIKPRLVSNNNLSGQSHADGLLKNQID